uniref:Uncharacterized protein n=1 Tax=Peronospora matthiolae TaxID=2874970 RepID=A0AAV1TS97_9STRA
MHLQLDTDGTGPALQVANVLKYCPQSRLSRLSLHRQRGLVNELHGTQTRGQGSACGTLHEARIPLHCCSPAPAL